MGLIGGSAGVVVHLTDCRAPTCLTQFKNNAFLRNLSRCSGRITALGQQESLFPRFVSRRLLSLSSLEIVTHDLLIAGSELSVPYKVLRSSSSGSQLCERCTEVLGVRTIRARREGTEKTERAGGTGPMHIFFKAKSVPCGPLLPPPPPSR